MSDQDSMKLIEPTVDIVAAYVSNNVVGKDDLPGLIAATHAALAALASSGAAPQADPVEEFPPAVSVRKSLGKRDHILSMIDGKPYRSLRRHLSAKGLTPESYRERYHLPATYPMVAPGYSEERSAMAKKIGLGRKPAAKRGRAKRT